MTKKAGARPAPRWSKAVGLADFDRQALRNGKKLGQLFRKRAPVS
jgi:hypothetical protein